MPMDSISAIQPTDLLAVKKQKIRTKRERGSAAAIADAASEDGDERATQRSPLAASQPSRDGRGSYSGEHPIFTSVPATIGFPPSKPGDNTSESGGAILIK